MWSVWHVMESFSMCDWYSKILNLAGIPMAVLYYSRRIIWNSRLPFSAILIVQSSIHFLLFFYFVYMQSVLICKSHSWLWDRRFKILVLLSIHMYNTEINSIGVYKHQRSSHECSTTGTSYPKLNLNLNLKSNWNSNPNPLYMYMYLAWSKICTSKCQITHNVHMSWNILVLVQTNASPMKFEGYMNYFLMPFFNPKGIVEGVMIY